MRSAPVRRLQRLAKWTGFALAGLAMAAAIPVAWVEGACTLPPDPAWSGGSRLGIADPGYARPAGDGYLAFAGRDVAYAYADLAAAAGSASRSGYDYLAGITGFWSGLCGVSGAAARTGDVSGGARAGSHATGLGLTAGLVLEGVYERTLGALTAWSAGSGRTAEDAFDARFLGAYAGHLRQAPWYGYPFGAELARFWRDVPFEPSLRAAERRVSLSLRYAAGAASAGAIASLAGPAPDAPPVRAVVEGLTAGDVAAEPRIRVVRAVDLGTGVPASLVEIPRGEALAEVLRGIAARGRALAEIAGNRRVLAIALLPAGWDPVLDGAYPLFALPAQAEPGRRRVGYDVEVASLLRQVRTLEAAGGRFEGVHD